MSKYILKNKDRSVLEFEVVEKEKDFESGKAILEFIENVNLQSEILPFGMDRTNINASLQSWIEKRKVPKNREFVDELIASYRKERSEKLMDYVDISLALSLNDSFWIIPADKDYKWKDYNLYQNEFDEALKLVAFSGLSNRIEHITSSPEFTTNGMLRKCWHRENNEIYLYKGNAQTKDSKEAYSEYYMAQVAKAMNFNAITYDLKLFHNELVSSCPIFTSENEGYVPIYHFLKEDIRNMKGLELIEELLKVYGNNKEQLIDLLFFDALICNTDRHLGNFGMIVDNNTGKILKPAPIFDNGLSMFSFMKYPNNEWFNKNTLNKNSWFKIDFKEQLFRYVRDRHYESLNVMQEFTFHKHHKFNLPDEWLLSAEKNIRFKVKIALQFIKEKQNTSIQNHTQEENLSLKEINAKLDEATQKQNLRASKPKPNSQKQEYIEENNENLKNSSNQNSNKNINKRKRI